MAVRRFLACRRGSAGVEMVLILPLLIVLLFGAIEIGYMIYMQHRVTDLARNYARFAARTVILSDASCPDATAVETTILARVAVDMPVITDWNDASTVDIACDSGFATGLYEPTGRDGPIVAVHLQGTYPAIATFLGFASMRWTARSSQYAAVTGL